jgi:hypothetical protein
VWSVRCMMCPDSVEDDECEDDDDDDDDSRWTEYPSVFSPVFHPRCV